MLLTPPLAWFLLVYLASLVVLLITAFWPINPFTTNIDRAWTLANFTRFSPARPTWASRRTVGMAAAVTVTDAVIAFPFAYFMARVAAQDEDRPVRGDPAAAVGELPGEGVLLGADLHQRRVPRLELGGPATASHLIYTNWAVYAVFCYLWLPFMIIPVYAALERVPASLIEASQDLGGRTWRTTRLVLFPLVLPGIVAGSIFTFSLTLGDYITPLLVGGTSANFIGNIIYTNIGIANNVPFAAAMAMVPIVIMGIYLPAPGRSARSRPCRPWNPWACGSRCASGSRSCCFSCSSRSR